MATAVPQAVDPEDEPILDLSSRPKRPMVRLSAGEVIELRVPGDFSVQEEHALRAEIQDFGKLQAKEGKLKSAEEARLGLLLNSIYTTITGGDKRPLTDHNKQKVIMFFRTSWLTDDVRTVTEIRETLQPEDSLTTES